MSIGIIVLIFIVLGIVGVGGLYFVGQSLLNDYKDFKKGLLENVDHIADMLSRMKSEMVVMVGTNKEEITQLKLELEEIKKQKNNMSNCQEIKPNTSYVVSLSNSISEEELSDIVEYFRSNNSQVLVLLEGKMQEVEE